MPLEEKTPLIYECPHCHKKIPISEGVIGEKVDCSNCGRPFSTEAPSAKLIGVAGAGQTDALEVQTKADDEGRSRKIHPTVFRRHLGGTLLNALLFLAGLAAIGSSFSFGPLGQDGLPLLIGGAILVLLPGFFLLKWFLISRTTYLVLNADRVIYRYGIVQKHTMEIRHDDVINIAVDQNWKERMLNFGDIGLSSAADDGMEIVIHDIPNPSEVAEFIGRQQA